MSKHARGAYEAADAGLLSPELAAGIGAREGGKKLVPRPIQLCGLKRHASVNAYATTTTVTAGPMRC